MTYQLWWIKGKGKNGKLARFGRRYDEVLDTVFEKGCPNPFPNKAEALKHCNPGEKAVKVKIVEVE